MPLSFEAAGKNDDWSKVLKKLANFLSNFKLNWSSKTFLWFSSCSKVKAFVLQFGDYFEFANKFSVSEELKKDIFMPLSLLLTLKMEVEKTTKVMIEPHFYSRHGFIQGNPLLRITWERPKIRYKRYSLYPGRISSEMELFPASKFIISGNSAYPCSL